MRLAIEEGRGRARREQGIELAVPQHADEGLLRTERLEIEPRDRLEGGPLSAPGLLLAAVAPMDLVWRYAVFMLQHAAHPHHGRDLVLGQTDPLAAQILRLADAAISTNIDTRMAENSRNESRNADIGRCAGRHRAQIARKRQFGDVEFR